MKIMAVIGLAVGAIIGFAFLNSFFVMWCWNYAVVPSCNAKEIDWSKAMALSVLLSTVGSSKTCKCKYKD